MKLTLKRLTLANFKGCRSFILELNGGDTSIFGDNATFKTTLFDAFCYLLTGKDSLNRKEFEVETLDSCGQVIHNLDHEVEADFDLDGKALTLKKVFSEDWTKKRGKATREVTGHTTNHFINGVPKSKGEYDTFVASSIASEDALKLLTNPLYFNESLHWTKRRELLVSVCGDVSDSDVIASDPQLSRLPEILGQYSMDDYKDIVNNRRKKINDELKAVPVRIDEATRALPDLTDIVPAALPDDITKLRQTIRNKEDEIARIRNNAQEVELTKQVRMIEVEMLDILRKDRVGYDEQVQVKREALNDTQSKIARMDADIRNNECSIRYREAQIADLEKAMGAGRKAWAEINAEQFTIEQATVCPTCGQALPQEQLDEARIKALAAFNLDKAQRLEANATKGKAAKIETDRLNGEIADLRRQNDTLQSGLTVERDAVTALQQGIANLEAQSGNYTGGDAYTAKAAEKAHLEREIEALKVGNQDAIAAVKQEILNLQQDLSALEDAQAKVRACETGKKRITELEKQEKKLAAEFERLEGELFLIETFIKTKVSLLEDKINSKFKLAHFKLFNVLVNQGIEETCLTMFNGVTYPDLNHGAKIAIGLDVIRTLSEYFGSTMPIWIDNCEAITKLPDMPCQMITLYVSAEDKVLRVEREEAAKIA